MSDEIIGNIIVALISGGSAIIGNQLLNNRKLSAQDIEHARSMQALEDRLKSVEKTQEEYSIILSKLNGLENGIISIKKDIEYLKERDKK